jgi:hypothetical protein
MTIETSEDPSLQTDESAHGDKCNRATLACQCAENDRARSECI